ncbi:MAG: AIPR family protein [Bacilli bacterium]|nr:AIPR family protein [Bacilli bacterium]
MANINDFKILNEKCKHYFTLFENENGKKFPNLNETQRMRFGFYYLMIGNICDIKDISDITPLITDMDFNKNICTEICEDCGVDAVYLDDESNIINIFNFKFREKYSSDKQQSINESMITTKFIHAIQNENCTGLNGKIKIAAEKIIELNNSKDIWKMKVYIISNENKELSGSIPEFENLKDLYDLEMVTIGLEKISQMLSLRPAPINAILHIEKDSLLPFSEDNLSTAKSFVIRISANELLRITCDNAEYRNDYSLEDYTKLYDTNMEYGVLFDNVRGFVVKSKFNKTMSQTLEKEPSKFFMYNNGLTITADDITSEDTNGKKKVKITITNMQVVNGGQTLRTLHEFKKLDKKNIDNYLANCQLLIRVFKTAKDNVTKNRIAEYTNSQNQISIIDLKSLASEQIQIEQFLAEKGVLYSRKTGDLGYMSENYEYKKQISMVKLGQILIAINGYPEKASNQKKAIFEDYYRDLFVEKFDIEKIEEYIDNYQNVKTAYSKLQDYTYSEQKVFYILYLNELDRCKFDSVNGLIEFFESVLKDFKTDDKRADSRKLIMVSFKEELKEKYISFPVKKD